MEIPVKKKRLSPKKRAHVATVLAHIQPGDLLTFRVCLGEIREMIFKGQVGAWLTGTETGDTAKLDGRRKRYFVDDVHPSHVLYVNRIPVESLDDYLAAGCPIRLKCSILSTPERSA